MDDKIHIGTLVEKELHERLERQAKVDFRSLSKTIQALLTEALDSRENAAARK